VPFGEQGLFSGYFWMRTSRCYIGKMLALELDSINLKVRNLFHEIRIIPILRAAFKIINYKFGN
jgi:hypothetical protein